jgi:hypothetical protein
MCSVLTVPKQVPQQFSLPAHGLNHPGCAENFAVIGLVAAMLASRDFKGIRRKRLPIFMLGADHAFQASPPKRSLVGRRPAECKKKFVTRPTKSTPS